MGFISIVERLKLLSSLRQNEAYTHLQPYLTLHEHIYRAHERFLVDYPTAITNWMDQFSITQLEKQSRDTNEPIIHFIEAGSFDPTLVLLLQEAILAFSQTDPAQTTKYMAYHSHVMVHHPDLIQLITAVLQGNDSGITSYANQFTLDASYFLFILSSTLQPFIEALAQKITPDFYEKWWHSRCPVCGRTPIVARIRKRRRYLLCAFCGAEYLSDHFLCVHCDNRDPYSLQYLHLDDHPAFRIDYCTKCHKYLKVINDDSIKEPIPRFLEDLLTLDLDLYAQHAGLTRDI